MRLCRRKPGPPLGEFVEALWLFDSSAPTQGKERALPDGCAQLIVNLREDRTTVYDRRDFQLCQTFNGCLIVGPQTEFCVIDRQEQMTLAGVHFKPGGAYPFLVPQADELQGLHVSLDALWGGLANELRERLLAAKTVEEQFDLFERALLARAKGTFERHPAVHFALQEFRTEPRTKSVADVVERTGFSARRFIELFRRQVGMTPKLFCRVQRFQSVLRRLCADGAVEWADVALDAGYFDQAHFIHDFRAFSGINPSTYRQTRPWYQNHVPLDLSS